MLNPGDIILIHNYKDDNNKEVKAHYFIILTNNPGKIEGLDFDIVCNPMSSFKDKDHRLDVLDSENNYEIKNEDWDPHINNLSGYAKVNQVYPFNLNKIPYEPISKLKQESFKALLEYFINLSPKKVFTNNL